MNPSPALRLREGTVIDGDGGPPVVRDVFVHEGRIHWQEMPGVEFEDIDARGLVVAPGFIDVHTHSDVSVLLDGRAQSKVLQGVTTEVIGNCGFSAFPLVADHRDEQLELLAGLGDDPVVPTWTDLNGYARTLEESGLALNVAPLVGHGQLRLAAGSRTEHVSEDELAAMEGLLETALDQGAFGMSTGLTYTPSGFARPDELRRLCAVLARSESLYATHSRGEEDRDIDEAVALARSTGVRVQYSHLSINDPQMWGRTMQRLRHFDEAQTEGLDVAFDVYPYNASASALTQYLPHWLQSGGHDALRARLTDEAGFTRAEEDLAQGWGDRHRIAWDWNRVVISRADGLLTVQDGETIIAAARRIGRTPERLVLELCALGGNRVQVVLYYRLMSDVDAFVLSPHSVIGSDGAALPIDIGDRRPHPRAYGTHARVLAYYVRERGLLTLPAAIAKMTGSAADRIGIRDRGRLREGWAGDIVVFDPARVLDRATFENPARSPIGVEYVIVNGRLVVREGEQTTTLPGRVLRS